MSTKALKIILHLLNALFLGCAFLVAGYGINALVSTYFINDITMQRSLRISWFWTVVGLLTLLLQVFGIYAVCKEDGAKLKTYGRIHCVFLILNIILNCLYEFKFSSLVLIFTGAIVYLSHKLANQFLEKKPPNESIA